MLDHIVLSLTGANRVRWGWDGPARSDAMMRPEKSSAERFQSQSRSRSSLRLALGTVMRDQERAVRVWC